MTVAELFRLSDILKQVMREQGHDFNLVVIPEQEVSDGSGDEKATDLHLTIVNATVRDVVVLPSPGNKAASDRRSAAVAERCRLKGVSDFPLVESYLNQLKSEGSLTTAALERQILLAEDIPGVSVEVFLRPDCDEVGGTQLVASVTVDEREYQASLDNRASKFTGPMEATAGVRFRSLITQGDEIGLTAYNTLNREQVFGLIDGSTARSERPACGCAAASGPAAPSPAISCAMSATTGCCSPPASG
ncbi:hypothetical protein DEW08_27790 (plasmid) [Azospirillum thermophilum]|uniref:Uncharacterized protein n=2 Tax=Azospirillum thermophilum TaxID=2202148 RepID=A0A2S2CZ29_9PROT|nr:hypothetical protein DEW08_27790 [Azospirillum thermophilum]